MKSEKTLRIARRAVPFVSGLATALITFTVTVLLARDLDATGDFRTVWISGFAVLVFIAADSLMTRAVELIGDWPAPAVPLMTVTCGTEGCPVEIEVTGHMSVEDDDRLVELATDHTRHGA